jgi:short chain dehydrogenase
MTTTDRYPFSRRDVVGGGVGIVATAAAAPAVAQNSTGAAAPGALQDPTEKHPKPPFPRQAQPWPGLAGRMIPRPDHGETSYRGSGRLAGRKALVTGGDSGMGRAAAIAFAREGAQVAINHIPEEQPDAQEVIDLIKAAGQNGLSIPGDIRALSRELNLAARNLEVPVLAHAAVAARHVWNASSRRARSVRREVR